jgi:hypothetical protein
MCLGGPRAGLIGAMLRPARALAPALPARLLCAQLLERLKCPLRKPSRRRICTCQVLPGRRIVAIRFGVTKSVRRKAGRQSPSQRKIPYFTQFLMPGAGLEPARGLHPRGF